MTHKSAATDQRVVTRPILLKVIVLAYFVLPPLFIVPLLLLVVGRLPMPAPPDPYFTQLNLVDHSLTIALVTAEMIGAALLWRFRRTAIHFFAAALVFNIVNFWWHTLMRGWVGAIHRMTPAMTGPVIVSTALGSALLLGVCVYTSRLTKAGVLR